MLKINNVAQANIVAIAFNILGDGVSTELKAALNKDPFNMTFNNLPSECKIDLGDPDLGTATATIAIVGADTILTVELTVAPEDNVSMNINVALLWNNIA